MPAEAALEAPASWVRGNAEVVDALYAALHRPSELHPDALRSAQVDHFTAQASTGGFAQFVYNGGWEPLGVGLLRQGLRAVGAPETAALVDEGVRLVARLGRERLQAFLASRFFGTNPERDVLGSLDRRLVLALEREDLVGPNAAFLRGHPDLAVVPAEALEARIGGWYDALPDRGVREAEAEAALPRYERLARAACAAADVTLRSVIAGDPTHSHEGCFRMGWHLETPRGTCVLVDAGEDAVLLDPSGTELARVPAR